MTKATIACLLYLLSLPSFGLEGRVIGVSDGDTIIVLDASNKQTRVRLAQIDAPEKSQDFGQVSKSALSSLVFGKTVVVEVETTDKYGRTVGRVLVGGQDANLAQVKAGMAWVYHQYAHDSAYFSAEESAKAARLGLWSRPDAVPPWEFRHGGRTDPTPTPGKMSVGSVTGNAACGTKRFCKEMSSCEEARFFLKTCGLQALDRDADGIACESLCK